MDCCLGCKSQSPLPIGIYTSNRCFVEYQFNQNGIIGKITSGQLNPSDDVAYLCLPAQQGSQ